LAFFAAAQRDSWLTLGISEEDQAYKLSDIGIEWDSWTTKKALENEDGDVFLMDTNQDNILHN